MGSRVILRLRSSYGEDNDYYVVLISADHKPHARGVGMGSGISCSWKFAKLGNSDLIGF